MRNRKALWFLAALTAATLVLTAVPAYGGSLIIPSYDNKGDWISNWYWLRSPGITGTWTFPAAYSWPAGTPDRIKGCKLNLAFSVTNQSSGGSGHDKHQARSVVVTSGNLSATFDLNLDNPAPVTSGDSRGAGYAAKGFIGPSPQLGGICENYFKTGKLSVKYSWQPTREACCGNNASPHHVAVNAQSFTLEV